MDREELRIAPPPEKIGKTNFLSYLIDTIYKSYHNCDITHHLKKYKIGFTLAEVLITLGIIGVVAAMTMPSLIHKFQNKVLETQYKKAVSIVSQAILKAKADYGLDNFAQYCTY